MKIEWRENVEVVEQKKLTEGFLPMHQLRLRFRQYNGAWTAWITRDCYTPNYKAAGVVLYDPILQQIGLVEQLRVGILFHPEQHPWVIEPVMGMMDPHEPPEMVAYREAEEEAGATIQRLIPLANYFVSPGTSSEYVYLFCGIVDMANIEGIHGLVEEQEDIRIVKFTLDEAKAAIANGRINNAAALIALQWIFLNQASLVHH